jgi:hypothetical protein
MAEVFELCQIKGDAFFQTWCHSFNLTVSKEQLGAKACTTYSSHLKNFPKNWGRFDLEKCLWFVSMTPATLITRRVTP